MPNINGTLNGKLIAQKALETLLVKFPILTQITTDFSAEAVKFNQDIVAHVVSAATASDYSTLTGYEASDRTQVDLPVTIDKHKHHTYAVNDQERSSTDINLIERYADTAAHALGKCIVDDLMALVTAANFPEASTIAEADFTRASIVDIGKKMNKKKVPALGRFMLLNSDYYAKLSLDEVVARSDANSGTNLIQTGVISNIHGFRVREYTDLPANAQNLQGFGGVRESLILAARLPKEPDVANKAGIIEVVTDPNTGLSVQLRQWYDMQKGKEFRTITFMYGVAKGQSDLIHRIKSL